MKEIDFMDIGGLAVGHAQNLDAATGCTVIISERGSTLGVDVRGGAPGTRETDLLNPENLIQKAHAVLLTGGSAFGLDAASGVMQFLEERKIGFDVKVTHVPIVCGAALFDLTAGDHAVRPDREMGYQACLNAKTDVCAQGSVGAGTGATTAKILGMERAVKGGTGHFAFQVGELKVGALVAVNCLGDVTDPESGKKLTGPLGDDMRTLLDTEKIMMDNYSARKDLFSGNTTIGIVVTNAKMTKADARKLASMAQNGYARTIRPAHTMYDGDTIFAMSAGDVRADLSVTGLMAARAMERAVVAAVKNARSLAGIMSLHDLDL